MSEPLERDDEWVDSLQGASTNFFTNTVNLGLTDEELAFLVTNRLPVSCAPKLIHEAIHHWFFQTMLGESIALAKMAACEHMKIGEEGAAINLAVRYTCLLNLLRPIMEGAALLGEFDVLPMSDGQSPIPPHCLLPLLFRRSTREMPSLMEGCKSHLVALMLTELRAHACFSDEKLRMLNTKGPNAVNYLFGYHDLRHWWTTFQLEEKGSHYKDGTLFLKLVYVYFFCDFKIASLLFDTSKSTDAAFDALSVYLARRVEYFANLAANDAVAEAFARPGGALSISELQELGVFDSDAHEGLTASGDPMMFVFGYKPLDRKTLPSLRIQENRKPFHLASVPIRFFAEGNLFRIETMRGKELFHGELGGDAGTVTEEGYLSSLIFMSECILAHTITVAGGVVYRAFYGPSELPDDVRAQIEKLDVNRIETDAAASAMQAELRRSVAASEAEQRWFDRCEAAKRDIYEFAGCPAENRMAARAWLDGLVESGLGKKFPDETWAHALALLGMSRARLDFDNDRPAELLSECGIDPAVLPQLEAISSHEHWGCEAFGWRFYLTGEEGCWWPMI